MVLYDHLKYLCDVIKRRLRLDVVYWLVNRLVEDRLLTLGLLFQEPVLDSVLIQMRGHCYQVLSFIFDGEVKCLIRKELCSIISEYCFACSAC